MSADLFTDIGDYVPPGGWEGYPLVGEVWELDTINSVGGMQSNNDPDYTVYEYFQHFKDIHGKHVKIFKIKRTPTGSLVWYYSLVDQPEAKGRLIRSCFKCRIQKSDIKEELKPGKYLENRCCLPHLGLCEDCKAQFHADMRNAKRKYQPELRTYAER